MFYDYDGFYGYLIPDGWCMVDIKSCTIQSSLQVGLYYFVGILGVWCIIEGPLGINIQNTLQLPMQEFEQTDLKHSPTATPVLTTILII